MKRFFTPGIIVFCLALSLSADDRKKLPQSHLIPGQTADIEAKLVTARQNCENWALAAGLETVLKQQNVALDQNFWVMRMNGGELCSAELPPARILADMVNKEFVLDNGRHVQLELKYLRGVPSNTDALVAGLRQQKISLLLFHGHPYYLIGATYDEYVNRDGSRMFIVTELRLANTFAREPGLTFAKGRDNMDEISALISVDVTPTQAHW